jgi:hypothetical protein
LVLDLIMKLSSAEEMCNNCPVNPVINLSTFFFPFKHLQDLICKMATIYEGLEKGIKKVLVINVL